MKTRQVLAAAVLLLTFCYLVSAQSSIVPIVEMKFGGLLGGVQNGKWLAPDKVRSKIKTETEFFIIGPNGVEEGGISFGKKGEEEDVCSDFQRMELDLKMDNGVAVGTDAKWNFTPRLPKEVGLNNQTYKTVVANFLRKKGIAKPVVKLAQALRIDLEGDGIDEILIAATYYKDGISFSAAAGDYSFVILRKVVGKKVVDHLLVGDFVTRPIKFGAPTENHISAIADLNGDGKMEIVLYGFYYEGNFASAFEMKAGKPVEIKEFRIACGV